MTDDRGQLVGLALALGAEDVPGWGPADAALVRGSAVRPAALALADTRARIADGGDPLGDAYLGLRDARARRREGAGPAPALVGAMLAWAAARGAPARVVDPSVGTGRFAVAAGQRFGAAQIVGVEADPVAAVLARGHLAAAGLAGRSLVMCRDYCGARLPAIVGATLFFGCPARVRHQLLPRAQKQWLVDVASARGLRASRLADQQVHAFFATAGLAAPGDRGVFVTAAEWLDVGAGRALRQLLAGELGLHTLQLVESEQPGAAAGAVVVTGFEPGYQGAVMLRAAAVASAPRGFEGGLLTSRSRLREAARWTPLFRARRPAAGGVSIGELFRVQRGPVTGANGVWIAGADTPPLPPALLAPAVTRARELLEAGEVLDDASRLRRVIDLPDELGGVLGAELDAFLAWARARGAAHGYVARHRRRWWAVGLHEPAPILATSIARSPPAFVRNTAGARHLNIAHGLYPRQPMSHGELDRLVAALNQAARSAEGRSYAGGLVKFEPGEIERLRVSWP